MISKSDIKNLINETEESYLKVAEILSTIKSRRDFKVTKLFNIQPILAESLYKLSSMYSDLSQEKKNYIERKSDLNTSWFNHRMKLINKYQNVVDYAISIGKFLGDHFAWSFYHLDRKKLYEHYQNDRIFYMPTGVGGLGELEYVKRVKYINNKVLIYHGTTSFLRLGDVTFFDLKESRVASIGEIKTRKINEKELSINLSLIGEKKEDVSLFDELIAERVPRVKEKKTTPLSSKVQSKLNRQLSKISKSIGKKGQTNKQSLLGDYEYDKINKLYHETPSSKIKHIQISDGLILGCYKPQKKNLSTILFKDLIPEIKNKAKGIESLVKNILIPKSKFNQLLIGDAINPKPNNYLHPSSTPFLFWPLDLNLFNEVVFFDTIFFTIYNPAHLIEKLIKNDFEVEIDGQRFFKVSSKIEDNHLEFGRLDHYINLITSEFYKEESVIEILKIVREQAKEGKLPHNKKIRIDIQSIS